MTQNGPRTISNCRLALLAVWACAQPAAAAQVQQLLNRIPPTANALVVIDVPAAYASPLAAAQDWATTAHAHGMITWPPEVDAVVMAAELDFEFMRPLWEIAVAHMARMPPLEEIAQRSGGQLDRLAGTAAVKRPNDSYVVALGPKVLGAMSPANRQQVVRWVRASRTRKAPDLPPYLADTLTEEKITDNQIVMLLNLTGVVSPAEVAKKLAQPELAMPDSLDIQQLAAVLASIRGLCLEIQLQHPPQGRLTIDFAQPATMLQGSIRSFLLAVLSQRGADLDDLRDWEVDANGHSLTLHGKFSSSGLRRVLSVLVGPTGPVTTSTQTTAPSSETVAEMSQRYFQSVTGYLDDLFVSDRQPGSLFQAKVWVQRYADRIANLDPQQVDPDVVAFGGDVVTLLDEIVHTIDRAESRSDFREANMYDSGRRRYGRYGVYGFFEKSYVTRDRQLIQADEAQRSFRDTQVIVNELRALCTNTRQTMTERYERPF